MRLTRENCRNPPVEKESVLILRVTSQIDTPQDNGLTRRRGRLKGMDLVQLGLGFDGGEF